ncbi:MAG: hypothetical protein WDM78_13025 [Puia sp.]
MKTYTRNFTLSRITYTLLTIALCADPALAQLKIDYGKSYVNITKGATGGTIEPGDILEVRATFVVGGSGVNDFVDSCAYFDVVPANTTYIPGSLAILTNEGLVYKTFTDALGDDAGGISGSNVQINLGYKNAPAATAFRRGRISYNDKPSFFGATCIMVVYLPRNRFGWIRIPGKSGRWYDFILSKRSCPYIRYISFGFCDGF